MAFNKEIWKAQKLSSFRLNMKAQLAGQIQDPSELIDKLSDEYEATIDKMFADHAQMSMEIQTEIQANKALKDYYAKVGGYKDNMLIFIDIIKENVSLSRCPIDISGSSMDDGNDKLFPVIDKNAIAYFFKTVLGEAVDLVFNINKVGKLLNYGGVSLGDAFIKNHLITVDYKNSGYMTRERKYIVYNAGNDFDIVLNKFWSDISTDMKYLNRVIFTRNDTPVEFVFQEVEYNTQFTNVIEFREKDEYKIASVLKRVNFPNTNEKSYMIFKHRNPQNEDQLLLNYYKNRNFETDQSSIMGDLKNSNEIIASAVRYCLKELEAYALLDHKEVDEYKNLDIYSKQHLSDRIRFLHRVVFDNMKQGTANNEFFLDIKGNAVNKAIDNSNGLFYGTIVKSTIFVDGVYDDTKNPYKNLPADIYGYSGDDTINASNHYKGVHVFSGLGSDNITTGEGNDIIYTNDSIADKTNDSIADKNDLENSDTTNTVHAGAGNDAIYGSNGIDKIYGEDGDDTIYGKKGDDILDGGKGIDHIFGGAGSDTINAESGENYIYTHTDSDTGEDLDTKNDTNTVDIKNATKNFIYGGRGIENITIDSGRSHIYTKENDDIVAISNGELNEIYLGAGSDTLSINGGNNNLVYTHTDGKNDIDKDTNEDTNTINITLGRNKIYGGKGIENITIQDGDNVIDTGDGDNIVTITGGKNNITLGKDNDTVVINSGDNTINGGDGKDSIIATSGKNHINGGIGKDSITTGDGDDTLIGGADEDADELNGGAGDDTYFVDANDIIDDSDHIEKVWFNSIARLTGGVETEPNSKTYKGGGYTYHLNGNTLQVRQDLTGKSITIKNYDQVKSSLGIVLTNKVGLKIVDVTETEGDNKESKFANITVELIGEIVGDGCLEVFVTGNDNKPIKFTSGCTTQSYKYDISAYNDFAVNNEKTRIVAGLTPYLIRNLSDTKNTVSYDSEHSSYGNLKLVDNDTPVYLMVKGSSASEKAEQLSGKVSLSRSLKQGEYVTVNIAGKKIEFTSANSSEEFKITWTDDKTEEEDSKFYITPSYISSNATVYYKGKGGKCKIIDDDKDKDPNDPKNYDPIIIDLNKNGVIETTNIDYGRRFDLDNNGFKESVAWVGNNDALLAIDKNNNGTIDNGNELFTNANFSNGFENLKSYDTNNDGIIDNKDEIWDKLILWQDKDEKFANLNLLVA